MARIASPEAESRLLPLREAVADWRRESPAAIIGAFTSPCSEARHRTKSSGSKQPFWLLWERKTTEEGEGLGLWDTAWRLAVSLEEHVATHRHGAGVGGGRVLG